MALSKDTIKNLLDTMQKVSLVVVALSIALVSNIMVSHPTVEKEAEAELTKLMAIRNNIGDKDAKHIIDDSLEELESNGYSHLRLELDTPDGGVLSQSVEV